MVICLIIVFEETECKREKNIFLWNSLKYAHVRLSVMKVISRYMYVYELVHSLQSKKNKNYSAVQYEDSNS